MPDKRKENENEEEAPEFKVIDRRQFTSDGQPRAGAEPVPPRKETPPPPSPPPSSPPPSSPPPSSPPPARGKQPELSGPDSAPAQRGPVNFQHLVLSLATTAMFQLGMMGNPGEEQPQVDMAAAQETIDLLNVLEKKTKGNLTQEEEGLLTNSLYELRMCFVEVSGKAGGGR